MKARFRVRAAESEDLRAVVALERSVAEAPHWRETEYAAMLDGGGGGAMQRCLLVAELYKEGGPEIAGFAVGRAVGVGAEAVGELESVVVAEESRRCGIGRALCEAVIGWCKVVGASQVELEVRSANDGAIRLYCCLGFVREGLRRGYYRDPEDDAVLMRMELRD